MYVKGAQEVAIPKGYTVYLGMLDTKACVETPATVWIEISGSLVSTESFAKVSLISSITKGRNMWLCGFFVVSLNRLLDKQVCCSVRRPNAHVTLHCYR